VTGVRCLVDPACPKSHLDQPVNATIRVERPGDFGRILTVLREKTGLSRWQVAARIAEASGQDTSTVRLQLWRLETGRTQRADLFVLLPILAWLDYDLALIPREGS
jgi:hypothetical protein